MMNFVVNNFAILTKTFLDRLKQSLDMYILFYATIFFKVTLDIGYWIILTKDQSTYIADFNIFKYMLGFAWCVLLFIGINHHERKASTFFLFFVYLIQIIPITTIYALANQNSAYYNILCIAFFICEMITWNNRHDVKIKQRNKTLSSLMILGFFCAVILVLISSFVENGLPTLTALDIYDVYEIRDDFKLNKYLNYLLAMVTQAIIPILITKYILEKKYVFSAVLCAIQFVFYLYTGNKTWLFMIPMVLIVVLWSKRDNFYKELFICFCLGMGVVTLLACFSPFMEEFWNNKFSLFGRRTMLLSANNKFVYYDYFSNNPHMGLGGIFPRWLIDIPNYYENIPYTYDISEIYFGKPEMQSNTGFLAEGFMRFGHIGTILILILFAMILRGIDNFQQREGFSASIGFFIYPIFILTDRYLLDSFVFGPWMVLLLVMIFYTNIEKVDYKIIFSNIKQKFLK